MTTVAKPKAAAPSTAVGAPRAYGDIVVSDEVHEEIRDLGRQVTNAIATCLPRDGTSEAQTLAAVRQFGPSKASKKMLNKENEAAMLALEKGVYVVWRCIPDRVGGGYMQTTNHHFREGTSTTHGAHAMLSGANDDFCTRVGYRSVCFCGHNLACHTMPAVGGKGGKGGKGGADSTPCGEAGCGCRRYQYIPNCPEEIGEGWLSRRKDWDAKQWSAKCRCGHGAKHHHAGTFACRDCGCAQFASHFLCVVCDQPWEAHETVVETEAERLSAGRPVREDFFPLSGVDWEVRELVLKDATGGGALAPPPSHKRIAGPPAKHSATTTALVEEIGPDGDPVEALPEYCPSCATIFRSAESNFCVKCGQQRRRR